MLYDPPPHLMGRLADGTASLIGAIIKDNSTGRILGHVQQTGMLQQSLSEMLGLSSGAFPPLGAAVSVLQAAVSVLQNEQIKHGIRQLQDGMALMQTLQYGTLALSGLNLGVSVAGFALMEMRLRGMEKHLDRIEDAIGQVTKDRRDDDIRAVLAEIQADLRNIDSLPTRESPARAAEALQIALDRQASRLETHFRREADTANRDSMTLDHLERLWTLAAAIRLCQEASLQALFIGNNLATAEINGLSLARGQIGLLDMVSPDQLARLVARHDPACHGKALGQAHLLSDGLRGGVESLVGQVSIVRTLAATGTSGLAYLREAREEHERELLFLPA